MTEAFFKTRLANPNYRNCQAATQIHTIDFIARNQEKGISTLISYCGFTQAAQLKSNTSEEITKNLWASFPPGR